jgi:hypothetical protein
VLGIANIVHGRQRYPWPVGEAREHTYRSGPVLYQEKLRPPWWWYVAALACAALLAAEFPGGGPVTEWLPWGVLLPVSVAIVWSLGRVEVALRDGELWVRSAHLPLQHVSGAVNLDNATLRRVVGREGDPRAFVSIRPWIGPGVQVWVDDPEDPTPYWVISTRHPDELLARLRELI